MPWKNIEGRRAYHRRYYQQAAVKAKRNAKRRKPPGATGARTEGPWAGKRKYQAEYYRRPEVQERLRKYRREYNNRPGVVAHKKEYARRPDVLERKRAQDSRRRKCPEKQRAIQLRLRYGLTIGQYEERLEAQKGKCAICEGPRGTRRFHVDHDHRTGKIRGLLCGMCNHALGQAKEDPAILERMAQYVRRGGWRQ